VSLPAQSSKPLRVCNSCHDELSRSSANADFNSRGEYVNIMYSIVYIAVLRIRDVYPGSRILIFTHPGSRIPNLGSRIPDPKTARKERGEKKLVVKPFYVATNFTKL
jgi:hypothetical protein